MSDKDDELSLIERFLRFMRHRLRRPQCPFVWRDWKDGDWYCIRRRGPHGRHQGDQDYMRAERA